MAHEAVLRAQQTDWGDHIEFALIVDNKLAGKMAVAEPATMVEQDRHTVVSAFTSVPRRNAQTLMDDLWRAGLRPTEGDSPGELSATRGHLKDMRTLVSKTLEVAL